MEQLLRRLWPPCWRQHAPAPAGGAPHDGAAADAAQPRHMTPCGCHCAACLAAGHGNGACVVLCAGLHVLFDGKADVVDLVLRHYYGACGWSTARFDSAIMCVQYGPAGDVIAAGDGVGRLHLICAQTGEQILRPLTGHQDSVYGVSFDPKSQILASCGRDKSVRLWDAGTGAPVGSPLRGHSKDNKECACTFGQYPMDYEANPDCPVKGHTGCINSVCFSPDGTRIVSGGDDDTVMVWDAASGEQLCSLTALTGLHQHLVMSMDWKNDGTKLATGSSADKMIKIWDPDTGECLSTFQLSSLESRFNGGVSSLVWSPCGSKIAVACFDWDTHDYFVQILNSESGALLCDVPGHIDLILSVAWSPDGMQLASSSRDMTVKIWNPATGEQQCQLTGHTGYVSSIHFSPDGKQLTSGSGDATVRNWNVATGASLS